MRRRLQQRESPQRVFRQGDPRFVVEVELHGCSCALKAVGVRLGAFTRRENVRGMGKLHGVWFASAELCAAPQTPCAEV